MRISDWSSDVCSSDLIQKHETEHIACLCHPVAEQGNGNGVGGDHIPVTIHQIGGTCELIDALPERSGDERGTAAFKCRVLPPRKRKHMGSLGWGEMQRFGDAGQGMAGYRRGAALFDTHAPDRADTCTCRYLLPAQTGRAPPALMLARFQSHCDAFSLGAEELAQSA